MTVYDEAGFAYDDWRHFAFEQTDASGFMDESIEEVHSSSSERSPLGSSRLSESTGLDLRSTSAFVAPNGTPGNTLFHYTDEAGLDGIVSSGELRPSLGSVNPSDVRYGNGQYVSDIAPGTMTCPQLSRCFLGQPFQGQRFTHFAEINVDGLNVVKGRDGVFVIPGDSPLDVTRRIVSSGAN